MKTRREMKREGRRSLKRHYLVFVTVCLIAALLRGEIGNSLNRRFGDVQTFEVKEIVSGQPEEIKMGLSSKEGILDVIYHMLSGQEEDARNLAEELKKQEIEKAETGNPMLGRSRGVLAGLVNDVTSGSIYVSLMSALTSITGSGSISNMIWIAGSFLLVFGFWFLFKNLYAVIARRIFLEGRTYEKLPIQRFLYLIRVRKWLKVACTMFLTSLFTALWSLTIVGGLIKRYSYYLVPYIAAENPDISPLQAIRLSRKMMQGHKWQCFLFELSYIGWGILGALSFGVTAVLYSNPYKIAAFSEYYAALRQRAQNEKIEGAELLNDRYLYEKAAPEVIQSTYADVVEALTQPDGIKALKGVRGFLARNFGIALFYRKEEREYEAFQERQIKYEVRKDAMEGKAYPGRLSPIPEKEKNKLVETLHYVRQYSVSSLIFLFFIFSFTGWIWEVSQHMIVTGEYVNRGVLHGPWLPIYGAGGILVLTLLNRLRKKPFREFIAIVLLCGGVEYFTALLLELTHDGARWWDYSGYFLNLQGRICAEGLLAFGIMGMAFVYVLAPLLDNMLRKIPARLAVPLCAVLLGLFLGDEVYSLGNPNTGKGITTVSVRQNGGEIQLPDRA